MNRSDGIDWKSSHFLSMKFLFYDNNAVWIHSHSFHLKEKNQESDGAVSRVVKKVAFIRTSTQSPQKLKPLNSNTAQRTGQRVQKEDVFAVLYLLLEWWNLLYLDIESPTPDVNMWPGTLSDNHQHHIFMPHYKNPQQLVHFFHFIF